MTPQEKAKELVDDMHYQICSDNGLSESDTTKLCAKQCALIAVYEIIKNEHDEDGKIYQYNNLQYWQDVKQEIQNL